MGNEDWRRRRADELLGGGVAPYVVDTSGNDPVWRPMVAAPDRPREPDRMSAPPRATRPAPGRPPRRAAHRRVPLALWSIDVLALVVAGALGWLLHAVIDRRPIAAAAAPRVVVPAPAALAIPPVVPESAAPPIGRGPRERTAVVAAPFPAAAKPTPPQPAAAKPTRTALAMARLPRRVAEGRPAVRPAAAKNAPKGGIGPSFNCRRARGETQRLICASPRLAALDRRLGERFAALDRNADPATVATIHRGETAFLNRRQACATAACVAAASRERLDELDAIGR